MWIRGWFPDGDRSHQRGYTLVNPDPEAGTVDIDFAMHDGLATRWAQGAERGDKLEVTVLGSNFDLPKPDPAGYLIVGDTASLPAINSLLAAIGDIPAQVFLEAGHDDDRQLPVDGSYPRDVGGSQERRPGADRGGQRSRVRRVGPLRLGGVRQPDHP